MAEPQVELVGFHLSWVDYSKVFVFFKVNELLNIDACGLEEPQQINILLRRWVLHIKDIKTIIYT